MHVVVMRVSDDTDDLELTIHCVLRHRDRSPNWVRTLEERLRKRLIHDRHRRCRDRIGEREIATGDSWDADRVEETRRDHIQCRMRGAAAGCFDRSGIAPATEWAIFGERRRSDARQDTRPLHDRGYEAPYPISRINLLLGLDREQDHAVGRPSKFSRLQIRERANKEAGHDQEHDREGDLNDDERFPDTGIPGAAD
jgi:hypothetical protein